MRELKKFTVKIDYELMSEVDYEIVAETEEAAKLIALYIFRDKHKANCINPVASIKP